MVFVLIVLQLVISHHFYPVETKQMENNNVVICIKRYLSMYHPIRRLLEPHTLYLLAINTKGFKTLIGPGGWVDKAASLGVDGLTEVMRRHYAIWNFSETEPRAEMKKRGVDELQYYPYRDDAYLIYDIINDFVRKIVNFYYKNPEDIAQDYELQDWAKALIEEATVKGLPGNGVIHNNEELIKILSIIIFTCSVTHGATNFGQYDHYGFVPNYPGAIRKVPPKNKNPITMTDIFHALPGKSTSLEQLTVTHYLSQKLTNKLGNYADAMYYENETKEFVNQFNEALIEAHATIEKRNQTRKRVYPYLDPLTIPNSIAI